jgi:hypothetical protein
MQKLKHTQTAALFMLLTIALFACKPEEKITKSPVTVNVKLTSSLPGKQIADNTQLELSGQGIVSQTVFPVAGIATFDLTLINGQAIDVEITAKENEGHLAAKGNYKIVSDATANLIMAAKDWRADVGFNTKIGSSVAPNINYVVSTTLENKNGVTDTQGHGNVNLELITNNYNEPQITPTHFKFTGSSIKEMNYDRSIVPKVVNNFDFDLTKQTYDHTFTVDVNSSISGKTPLFTSATGIYNYGSGDVSFTPTASNVISFISEDENEDVTVSVSNVPGHYDGNINVNNTGSALKNGQTATLTLEGIVYTANVGFSAENSETHNNIPNASFQYKLNNSSYLTTGPGTINFTLETDANNIFTTRNK